MKLVVDEHPEKLKLVGPSFNGRVYRSEIGQLIYRLIPMSEAPLKKRDEIRKWVGKRLGNGVATIKDAYQPEDVPGVYVVRYEVRHFSGTLAQALEDPDQRVRLQRMASVLRAVPVWWDTLTSPLLPMPADIAFDSSGAAYLLPMPFFGLPGVEKIFADLERGLYLAPELVRGIAGIDGRSVDRFVLGVELLRCFFELSLPAKPSDILLQAASWSLLSPDNMESSLPYWLERLPATEQAIAAAQRLLSYEPERRNQIDLLDLARRADQWLEWMDPMKAAIDLRAKGKPLEAFALLTDILLSEESYDLLVLAAETASRFLDRPLEATDLYERAITMDPQKPEAYEGQFRAIAAGRHKTQLKKFMEIDSPARESIDNRIQRDFARIALDPEVGKSCELEMAEYYLWRGQYDTAAAFIYERLFEGDKHLWWKFEMNLAYARALTGQRRYAEAREQLRAIKDALTLAQTTGNFSEQDLRPHRQSLMRIEMNLHEVMQRDRSENS